MTIVPKPAIPVWVLVALWLMTGLTIVFTLLGYFRPELLFASTWSAWQAQGALALTGPLGFYIARNVATIAISLYVLTDRSLATIRALLVLRIVTETMDGVHYVIGGGDAAPTIVPFVLAVIELAAFLRIRKLDG